MNTAIGYAHYQLAGGNRALVRWCIGFIMLAGLGLSAYSRYGGGGPTAAAAASTSPAMILLAIIFILIVNGRIGTAIKLDNTLDMARSHRLMAVSAPSAVMGYLIGPTLPILAVAALAIAYTAGGYIAGGYDLAALIAALGLLLALASALATLNVMSGIGGKGGGIGWLWGVGAGAFFGTGGAIFGAVPWTVSLLAPFGGVTIFRLHDVQGIGVGHAVGALMHLSLAGIFFLAACRRWRRIDRPALSPVLWLGLIALVIVGTIAGVHWYDVMRIGVFNNLDPNPSISLPATLTLLILMAHGPLTSHERLAAAWRLRKNVNDPAAHEDKPALPAWGLVGLILLLLSPLGLILPDFAPDSAIELRTLLGPRGAGLLADEAQLLRWAWPVTAVAITAALVTAWATVRGLTRIRAGGYIVWVYAGLWVVPTAIAVGQALWVHGHLDHGIGRAAVFGMPGALYHAWSGKMSLIWIGVGFQCAVAGALAIVALRVPDRVATPITRDAPQVNAAKG